jgi:hypothetical protein
LPAAADTEPFETMRPLPAILTEANWNKNKGTFAKMAGETGVGAALKKLTDLYNAIDWAQLEAGGYGKLHNNEEVDAALVKAKAYYASKVEPVRTQLRAVEKLGNDTAAKFKANKLIPGASTKHVQNLATEADHFAVELKSLDTEFKTFEAAKQKLAEQIKLQINMMKPSLAKLAEGIKKTLANPTKEEWGNSMAQQCRSVCNGLKVVPEWNAQFWKTWEKNDGMRFQSQLTGAPEDAALIKSEVARIAGDFKTLVAGLQ